MSDSEKWLQRCDIDPKTFAHMRQQAHEEMRLRAGLPEGFFQPSDQVTGDIVGKYFQTSPLAHAAVYAKVSKGEFIRLLLGEVERLTEALLESRKREAIPKILPGGPR